MGFNPKFWEWGSKEAKVDAVKSIVGSDLPSSLFSRAYSIRELFERYGDIKNPYVENPWVYACVRTIAENCKQSDFILQRYTKDNKPVLVEDGPVYKLIERPNPHMTFDDIMDRVIVDLSLYGCYFILKDRDARGKVVELWPLEAETMSPVIDKKTKLIVGWAQNVGETETKYSYEDVIWGHTYLPGSSWKGLAPITPAWNSILAEQYSSVHQANLLKNKAVPEGILKSENKLTPDQVKQIRERWEAMHKGVDKVGKVAILEGSMSYERISFSNKDLGLLAQQTWNRDAIMAVFRVPKFMVSLYEDINFATAKEARRTFWQETLIPILKGVEATLQSQLVSSLDPTLYGTFDLSSIDALQQDFSAQLDNALKLQTLGYSTNDINARLELGMPEVKAPTPEDAPKATIPEVVKSETTLEEQVNTVTSLLDSHIDTLATKIKSSMWSVRKALLEDPSKFEAAMSKMQAKLNKEVAHVREEYLNDLVDSNKISPLIAEKLHQKPDEAPKSKVADLVSCIFERLSDDLYNREAVKQTLNAAGIACSDIAKNEMNLFETYLDNLRNQEVTNEK